MGTITIVGLGPADGSLVTAQTTDAIAAAARCFVRTTRHPAAAVLAPTAVSFDDVYETAADFDEVYETIAARLIDEAAAGDLLYAVPGSPLVLERSVAILRERAGAAGVGLVELPAVSFLDLVWQRMGDPVESNVTLIDGHRFAEQAAGRAGPFLVAHCHSKAVLSDIKLAIDEPPSEVIVLRHLGLDSETVSPVAWADLDRDVAADHLTSLWIGPLTEPVAPEFARFEELVRVLREQCPWDRKQTHASLRQHLLEETHETLEAIDARAALADDEYDADLDEHLAEELGDLLYQIFFHARLASERGAFTVADVARGVHDKLVVRHPHVFGDVSADDADTVLSNWEAIKREEKGRESAMDGIPSALPALLFALKSQKRAAGVGFDWSGGPEVAYADVEDELAEVREDPSEHEVGDLLFAAVQVARRLDIDPESALRGAANRFIRRFRSVEAMAADDGLDIAGASVPELESLWQRAKAAD
ncbi:MAG: nucleoside triphosphate pyrophosphohydrolase [Acidimicrobiales bacterium]|nr:nucleoside triphosphate pyrophosphohydrolase [Acidimicrobiales bacterium]